MHYLKEKNKIILDTRSTLCKQRKQIKIENKKLTNTIQGNNYIKSDHENRKYNHAKGNMTITGDSIKEDTQPQ
ncbi:UNVERIFIED_CONTAM: hypothetical protein NY100_32805, partial [Prevotella sp. 15_C9]